MTQAIKDISGFVADLFWKLIFVLWKIVTWPYFIHVISAILLIWLCYFLFKEYKKWNQGWLSNLIEKDISETATKRENKPDKNYKLNLDSKGILRVIELIKFRLLEIIGNTIEYFKDKVSYDIKHLYLPSPTSLLILLVIAVVSFVFSHSGVPYKTFLEIHNWFNVLSGNIEVVDLSNVISVLGGFVSIVFALVIFIAESIRDNKNPEQKRVLLKVSGLWFLVTLTTLSLLNFLWFKLTIFALIFPLAIAGGIIYSFKNVIFTLIDPEVREENRVKLLKERIKKIIFESIRERIGNNILLNKVGQDKEIKIEYTFSKHWLDRSASDYIFIESIKEGWLSDINLVELDGLVKRLENSAQQLGFSLYLNTSPSLIGRTEDQATIQSQTKSGRIKKVYLLKRYGEYLPPSSIFTEDSKIILAIPKDFEKDPNLIEYVRNLVPHIFRFRQTEPSSNAFRRELQGTKDQLVGAIKALSLGSIEELKQVYLDFI